MPQPSLTPIVLDVDTGIDDAVALILASRSSQSRLLGVTTVAGNVDVQLATRNTLAILDQIGQSDVPVFPGLAEPLIGPTRRALDYHGETGLGGLRVAEPSRAAEQRSAPDAIVRLARSHARELVLVCLAPLSNLAVALKLEPALPQLIRRVIVMGGAFWQPGNATPDAEFNAWGDPEAADIVARSQLPVTYVGLDVTHQVPLARAAWQALPVAHYPDLALVSALYRHRFEAPGQAAPFLHDPLALAAASEPSLVETVPAAVRVASSDDPRAGRTELGGDEERPVHQVARTVDVARFFQFLTDHLAQGDAALSDQWLRAALGAGAGS